MVDPKHEPGFEEPTHPEHPEKEQEIKLKLRQQWRERMHSRLRSMSRGAQNFWYSMHWAHKDNWRRKDKKK